jgi:hypothetical protein
MTRWEFASFLEYLANFVPVELRETGMSGVLNGTREEVLAGANFELVASGQRNGVYLTTHRFWLP